MMKAFSVVTFFLALSLLITPGSASKAQDAAPPSLRLPVACALDADCWVVNYPDIDPSHAATDYLCGHRTYEAHFGTDFAVADLVAAEQGVPVLAAAAGKVLRVRDGVDDKIVTDDERKTLLETNKGCGNGVFIDHGDGWQSIYCHLKKDSIAVKPDQTVAAGDSLGAVGYSGIAEFPHLHFGIFRDNIPYDPFTGAAIAVTGESRSCAAPQSAADLAPRAGALWQGDGVPQGYQPAIIYAAGFKAGTPDFESVKIDAAAPLAISRDAEILSFWAGLFGAAKGDDIVLEIRDPAGEIYARRQITQDKNRARQFYFVGRRTAQAKLTKGLYRGYVRITRTLGGDAPYITEKTIEIPVN